MPEKPLVELINEQIDHWLEEEAAAQRRLDFCHAQLDRYLGMKTLKLVQGGQDEQTRISGGGEHHPA